VLGRVLALGLDVMGTNRSIRLDRSFADEIDQLASDAENDLTLTKRELLHAQAIVKFAYGCAVYLDVA
jgi:hypothetical protein